MATLKIEGVKKRFGALEILKGIDLDLADGEFLVFLGPSGCGKSTLLNIIAGLDTLSEGRIVIDERVVNDVHPKDRDIAMVFQSYALYPNMTVARNIAFALEMRGIARAERDAAVRKVAALLQIEHLLERKPAQLSGGQRQRVAIGRALVRDPKIFLFDEPLSNLDARLRVDMRTEIKKLHQRLGTTIVYVTHDQIEAMTLASRIAVMRDGLVQQFATPQEVYERPANMYVAGFIGSPPMNFIAGRIAQQDSRLGIAVERVAHEKTAPLFLPLPDAAAVAGMENRAIVLGVRPEAIGFANGTDHPAQVRFDCAVSVLEPTGADTMAVIRLGEHEAVARIRPNDPAAPGATAPFVIDMTKVNLFDPQSERRL